MLGVVAALAAIPMRAAEADEVVSGVAGDAAAGVGEDLEVPVRGVVAALAAIPMRAVEAGGVAPGVGEAPEVLGVVAALAATPMRADEVVAVPREKVRRW